MIFTPKQQAIWDYDRDHSPRITILEGAVRSGKSYLNNFMWVKHVRRLKNRQLNFIMTGATLASLQRNVLDDLGSIFELRTNLNKRNEFKMYGNTVACFGADKIDSYRALKGFTAHGWYANEITEHHINTIAQAQNRCSGEGARIFWDTNPAGPNHHVKMHYVDHDGQMLADGRVNIKSWHFTLDDNPFLPREYVESLKLNTPSGMWYDRDILGLWVAAEGMIYRDFDLGVHVIDMAPGNLKEYFAGIDWGFEHNGVIGVYGLDHDGNAFRLREIVAKQQSIDWWAHEAMELNNTHHGLTFYADPARPDHIAALRNKGLVVREAENSVVEGITFVAECFKKRRLYIVQQYNRNYLREIYNYRWKENAAKEEPIKMDDDSMDSERYALYSHLGRGREVRATISLYR